jgi:polar amino acid transport system permease protein
MVVAVGGALGKTSGPKPVRLAIDSYIELIRNTPFLVQIFIMYFSLPMIGLRLTANTAALLAMTVNLGAYASEIVRAGIEAIPQGQVEAARALGLKRLQIFRFIIIFPALKTVYPALSSQFILLMLSSSVVSTISAVELTAITNSLQSTTFRAFEFYFVATGLYLAMALGFRAALGAIYWAAFQRGRAG